MESGLRVNPSIMIDGLRTDDLMGLCPWILTSWALIHTGAPLVTGPEEGRPQRSALTHVLLQCLEALLKVMQHLQSEHGQFLHGKQEFITVHFQ